MTDPNVQNLKKLLRTRLNEQRAIHAKDPSHSASLATQLFELATRVGAKTVAAYLPFGAEPNITTFISGASAHGIRLIMPVSNIDGTLHWVAYTGASAPGIFGFDEPVGENVELAVAELILIPATAVDEAGNRLGKGKGFYDVALADPNVNAPVAAIVYDAEVLNDLPVENHDQPVDFVVTPRRIIETNSGHQD